MSIETPTLDEFHDEEEEERAADEDIDGARYRIGAAGVGERTPEDAGCCRSCGTPVSDAATRPSEIKRMFGDEHGRVRAGPCCNDVQTFSKAIQGADKTTEQVRELTAVEAHRREGADL